MAEITAVLAGPNCGVDVYESPSREVYVECEVTKSWYSMIIAIPILIVVAIFCIWFGSTPVAVGGTLICGLLIAAAIFHSTYYARISAEHIYDTFAVELNSYMSSGDSRSVAIDKIRAKQLQREATAATLQASRQQSASILAAANIMRNK